MSKIICDVCGTAYPETATQCPICGCVRPGDAVTVAGDTNEAEAQSTGTYTYVKGGRFSKSNVKKRNQGKLTPDREAAPQPEKPVVEEGKNDRGLVIAVVALLLAIVAIVIYIALRFFAPGLMQGNKPGDGASAGSNTSGTIDDTSESTTLKTPCVDVIVSKTVIEFDKAGAALLLNVTVDPVDTTDVVTFSSSDENVATVSQDGKVTAISGGQAVITITCGTAQTECNVICNIEGESTETTVSPTISADDFKLNREDFTLNSKGATWKLYTGDIPADQIAWRSDDESVATIKDGVVTAVGSGMTTVYGEYGGIKLSCIVRCSGSVGKAEQGIAGSGNVSESGGTATGYSISTTDVTIKVGETFSLTLKDSGGKPVSVVWTPADTATCTVSGNSVTGASAGRTVVSTTYEGTIYSCIVRVTG